MKGQLTPDLNRSRLIQFPRAFYNYEVMNLVDAVRTTALTVQFYRSAIEVHSNRAFSSYSCSSATSTFHYHYRCLFSQSWESLEFLNLNT